MNLQIEEFNSGRIKDKDKNAYSFGVNDRASAIIACFEVAHFSFGDSGFQSLDSRHKLEVYE